MQDRKFEPKMGDEIFMAKNHLLFEIKLPLTVNLLKLAY